MNSDMKKLQVLMVVITLLIPCGFAQKIKVGYAKGTDFSKYKSYTLQLPETQSSRPLLYASVVGSIRQGIEAKGLVSKEKDGDLTVIAAGGLDYGLGTKDVLADTCDRCKAPAIDPMEWAGYNPPPGSSGKPRPDGVLELQFVDRTGNKVVWTGSVMQKLDPAKRDQSLEKIGAAINKLLMEYPPKAK